MQFIRAISLIIVFTTLTSCGLVATKNEEAFMASTPESAWGDTPTGYETPISQHIKKTLLDPESARFKFGKPSRTSAPIDYMREKNRPVWIVTVYVNAKNRFGGYVGDKARMYYLEWAADKKLKLTALEYDE